MSTTLPAGPYEQLRLPDGSLAPWYIIPFDKRGNCKAPQTRAHLVEAVRNGSFTDCFLFSHGWNNDWETANRRYQDFIAQYQGLRQRVGLAAGPAPYRPILVGITWPSTDLVLPSEQGPAMAGAGDAQRDPEVGAEQEALAEIADDLSDQEAARFYELVGRDRLTEAEALELARILAPLYARAEDAPEDGQDQAHDPEQLVELWKRAAVVTGEAEAPGHGFADEGGAAPGDRGAHGCPVADAGDPARGHAHHRRHSGFGEGGGRLHHPAQEIGVLRKGGDQGIPPGRQEHGSDHVPVLPDGGFRCGRRARPGRTAGRARCRPGWPGAWLRIFPRPSG